MTKMTNKKIGFLFGRKVGKVRKVLLSNTHLEHLADIASGVFAYRAPHAPRPTAPRKRFI